MYFSLGDWLRPGMVYKWAGIVRHGMSAKEGIISRTCQKMLLAWAPFSRWIFVKGPLVSAEAVWKIQTDSSSCPASRERSDDVIAIPEVDVYKPGASVLPAGTTMLPEV